MRDRRYSWGAEPVGNGAWSFALWAPGCDRIALRLGGTDRPMTAGRDGWFTATAAAAEGMPYAFVLPDGMAVPDPAARRQQGDVHGASLLTAPRQPAFWGSRPWEEAVIYELHVGTFTAAGTLAAAAAELGRLAALGFTAIEIMPLAQFGGDRGWGYDGVLPYAPHNVYGTPGDLAGLVAAANGHGLMVLLDVVYNHFGPDGNYLPLYAPDFLDPGRTTPWGAGIDYTQPPVRRFFIENALYWLTEFGIDGLRIDAIDQIVDPSDPELLVELATEIRRLGRPVHLTTEDNRNLTHLHARGPGGAVTGHTAEWNDDFHNAAHVLATGETEGYYGDFADDPLGLLGRALAEGFAFQGETGRGAPSGHLPPTAFVDFLQNHDQTGNRARGERLIALSDPETLAVLTAILALSPHIPLFFMGEEYGEARPFTFFAHFGGALDEAVRSGRRAEFTGFQGFAAADIPDPIAWDTFAGARLDPARRDSAAGRDHARQLRHLLGLRHRLIVPHLAGAPGHGGTLIEAAGGRLAVDWRLAGARLALRARFGPADLPAGAGVEINRTGSAKAAAEAVHYLATGPDGGA
ncbi:MAG TPA: malto-oligosyltrehalose trehalohydrolase [Rhodobacteraceae bacterium]|jgi:maltooligosyltrehalose trehalohydrolase|nr:malto-oligosyltrehalose trehalohydrolase [Paracoccaceae bacterium]HBG99017.1 malto-oligosyltrehalose trehalohydrolase [Paracoccaceae bacterium]